MASVPYSPSGIPTDGMKPMMTPNEAPKTPKEGTSEEKKVSKLVKRMYDNAKKSRKKFDDKWSTYWDFYRGKQWPVKRPVDKASPNCNIIASAINTIAPILTDTSPSFGVLAREPRDIRFAELLTQVQKVIWDRRSMNHVLVESIMDCLVTDVGVLKITWDDSEDAGLGDLKVVAVDPRRIYVPGGAADFDRDCPYVVHEFFLSRGELSLKFPTHFDAISEVRAYVGDSTGSKETSDTDTRVRVVSPVNKDVDAPDSGGDDGGISFNDDIRVWECWMRDDTVIQEQQINADPDAKKPTTVTKKKYPRGRLVTMLPDSNTVLQDVENPYRDGEFPFVRIVDMLVPRCFYGMGEVVGLSETQRMINKTFAVIMDWANLMSNPSWVVDSNSGVDPDMLTSDVGQIIVKNPKTEVTRQSAPPVPPQLFELYHTLMSLADTQSGVHEVTQGRKPSGITAAAAIETLQEAAQTRIRLKERNLIVSLTRLGRLMVSRVLQYYTEPRVIKLTGMDDYGGVWPPYVRFFVEEREDGYVANIQSINYDEGVQGYVEQPAEETEVTIGEFEIDVTSGTSLPFIKEQRSNQAIRLFENQAIDRQALLDTLDFPDKDAVLQRMDEEAAQAEQAPPEGAPPPPGVM